MFAVLRQPLSAAALSATLLTMSNAARADAPPTRLTSRPVDPGVSLAIQASTLGIGVQAGKQISPNFAARLGVNSFNYSINNVNSSGSDLSFDGHLKLSSVSLLADIYPTAKTSFHLTAGIVENSNTVRADAAPNAGADATYTVNGDTYTAAQIGTATARATFPKTAPYVGFGLGKTAGPGSAIRTYFDLGVLFQGTARVTVSHTGTAPSATNFDTDAKTVIENGIRHFKLYPMLGFGVALHI